MISKTAPHTIIIAPTSRSFIFSLKINAESKIDMITDNIEIGSAIETSISKKAIRSNKYEYALDILPKINCFFRSLYTSKVNLIFLLNIR